MAAESTENDGYLTGQLLIAMPNMRDPRFARSVIYLCAHNEDGAIGLVINRLIGSITFPDLLTQLDIDSECGSDRSQPAVHFGGPVETERGFVLHSADYLQDDSMAIDGSVALTATVDIVRDIAEGGGPRESILALGYAGWGPGQLDGEIQENAWLNVESDAGLVFDPDLDAKWDRAIAKLGIDAALLSSEAGRA
ncbi:MAG: YqgE/AlgH family protein [Rhodospirillaceae bacterium]|jgi:putative transcriptional regulator|nr:YqgE/AlgH family protein [Rhodospirillaceae bacterium]MBT6140195.1 YqgE/AlgH family protein [Rhodospirillaceae bacterium]